MSAENPTDFDYEIIKFMDWLKDNYTIVENTKTGKNEWCIMGKKVYHFEDTTFVLAVYEKYKENDKS